VEPDEAARAWVAAWERGWAAHDPDVIAARYVEGCVFVSHPFREPLRGPEGARGYAQEAFAEERSSRASFGEPIVGPDGRAAVEYRATITAPDGEKATLAGVSVLRFDEAGLVTEHHDYWAIHGSTH
jgi:ketosteroid isomerase-like protein